MKSSSLQNAVTFLADLRRSTSHAKKRVWIEMMIFEIAPQMHDYIRLLCDAAHRGVDVRLTIDWITFRYYGKNLDVYPSLRRETIHKRKRVIRLAGEMVAKLRNAGVRVSIDNTPSRLGEFFLLGKRNHNKICIIDDIAWIGGTNMIKDPESFVDFMVKISNLQLVNVLIDYLSDKPSQDKKIPVNATYTFFYDCGKKGHSLIYDEACAVMKEAHRTIILVSQMLPDSTLLSLLRQKSLEGVKVTVLISNRGHNIFTKFPFRYHYQLFQKKIRHNQHFKLFHSSQRIHAKLLLVDHEKAFFGSHNFEKWNELIGIEETDFLTTDQQLIQQFEIFWKSITY